MAVVISYNSSTKSYFLRVSNMPLFRNGHENDSDSFRIISGFEYNLSPNLFFHTP